MNPDNDVCTYKPIQLLTTITTKKIDDLWEPTMSIIQEFSGRVLGVDKRKKEFNVELINKNDDTEVLEGTFKIKSIPKGDLELLRAGALIVWLVGKDKHTHRIMSRLIIRRLPSWDAIRI